MRRPTFVAAAFVILVTAALGSFPAPALAQADNDMPCWMYDPIGGDCTSGGGGGQCQDCGYMYNPATADSFCVCAAVQQGGWHSCNVQPRDPICESCQVRDQCPR
jgi:hypothetical protein